ncbi:putative ROK family transcriptional regulator [Actinacidiphila reveromycinica]|uniref:Putative ROK family transcriptional regulator n=1 Tax=Actinacidiphila reveromycinica TaxID=659352 RepID=A0A7U3V0I8_9ACTN|nr:ROK family transcriptional regulator [Streptomyces sp. SN-593]BBB02105.1 putative ROK family transcriptional regulator [Streptomyces sp. SN-593]
MTEIAPGGDLSQLRRLNSLALISVVREEPGLTLTEISRRTGLSRASTEDVVRGLLERGWLADVPAAAGAVGRPARRYRFRADAGRVLGVDIGGHKILALVADLDGTVLHSARVAVAQAMGRKDRLAALDRAVADALAGAGASAGDIWAAGAATTGLVDGAGRVMLSEALPEWTGVDVAAHLRRRVGGAVLVENDSKLAALAESWRGAARYAKDVVLILAGLRTGAGLIIDGKLHRGFGNAAGEIGALPASGWIRAQEHLKSWPPTGRADAAGQGGAGREVPGQGVGSPGAEGADAVGRAAADQDAAAEAVFEAARAGDRKAAAVVRRYVRDVAVGAAALVLTLDPELVVIGGGFSRSADLIVEPLRRELDRWCIRTPEVRVSEFGDEGVALGALRLALDHVDGELRESVDLGGPEFVARQLAAAGGARAGASR